MPTNDQDARALCYLARRIRQDTPGAGTWDEAGTYAAVAKLIGTNLYEAIERVTRHAADRNARTPAAIGRPFLPNPPTKPQPRNTGPWCRTCGVSEHLHPGGDHEFTARRTQRLAADQIHEVTAELRDHLQPTRPRPEPREPEHDPRAATVRAAITTEEDQ